MTSKRKPQANTVEDLRALPSTYAAFKGERAKIHLAPNAPTECPPGCITCYIITDEQPDAMKKIIERLSRESGGSGYSTYVYAYIPAIDVQQLQ